MITQCVYSGLARFGGNVLCVRFIVYLRGVVQKFGSSCRDWFQELDRDETISLDKNWCKALAVELIDHGELDETNCIENMMLCLNDDILVYGKQHSLSIVIIDMIWCRSAKAAVHKHTSSFCNMCNQNNDNHHRL